MRRANLILQTDVYKLGHWAMTLAGTTKFFSHMMPRLGGKFAEMTNIGLQYYMKEYLEGARVTDEDIEEAIDVSQAVLGAASNVNLMMWHRIVHAHGGRLPLRICSWDEGTKVPAGFPNMSVVNTDPTCSALTNHVEPLLLKVWYPMTVATISGWVIDRLGELVKRTGGPEGFERYMLHDFGYRGVSSEESARIGGAAHLVHGQGTDTLQAIPFLRDYYGASYTGLASSVPASEHSIMTAGGPQREVEIAESIIRTHRNSIVSLVADSFNYHAFVDAMIDRKDLVAECGVTLVLRPDSPTPQCPTPTEVMLWTLNRYAERLPITKTQTGHTVTHYGALWGDGIGPEGIVEIAEAVARSGFAVHKTVYGMGGGLLQKVDRDTGRFAFKCSAQERDGQWYDIKKEPLDKTKASIGGRMTVVNFGGYNQIAPEDAWPLTHSNIQMKPVFENGVILRQSTFDQIRERARK